MNNNTNNIDENDVEASHSLSSGTIDEETAIAVNLEGYINVAEKYCYICVGILRNDAFSANKSRQQLLQ